MQANWRQTSGERHADYSTTTNARSPFIIVWFRAVTRGKQHRSDKNPNGSLDNTNLIDSNEGFYFGSEDDVAY